MHGRGWPGFWILIGFAARVGAVWLCWHIFSVADRFWAPTVSRVVLRSVALDVVSTGVENVGRLKRTRTEKLGEGRCRSYELREEQLNVEDAEVSFEAALLNLFQHLELAWRRSNRETAAEAQGAATWANIGRMTQQSNNSKGLWLFRVH